MKTFEPIQETHPAQIALARVFTAVRLMGPPMGEPLVSLISHLFTPEEAEVAVHLPFYAPKSVSKIAKRAKRSAEIIAPILDRLGERRVILKTKTGYSLLPIIPGMFEHMLIDGRDSPWHREYARLLNRLYGTGYTEIYSRRKSNAIRNIPIRMEIQAEHRLATLDMMGEMIDRHGAMSVANVCQCRQSIVFDDRSCKRGGPEDGCLIFGSFAESSARGGNSRLVSKEEMRDVVTDRMERKMVFLTGNVSPVNPNAICTCCDCCCHYLESFNKFGGESLLAPPPALAEVDEDSCKDCGRCAKACNTRAHTFENKKHAYNEDLCIGCGYCVEECKKNDAIKMVANPAYKEPYNSFGHLSRNLLPGTLLTGIQAKLSR